MKKVIFLIFILLCLVGCGKEKEDYGKIMEEYATTFYNLHLKGDADLTTYTLTIADLKQAIILAGDSYDLKKLEACDDSSSITININDEQLIFEATMVCD